MKRLLFQLRWHGGLALPLTIAALMLGGTNAAEAANLLSNPGFESPDASAGDVYASTDWGGFNDVYTTITEAHSGDQSLKIYGPFFAGGGAGAVQNIGAASEGEIFNLSAYALNSSADPIDPSNFAVVKLEFLNNVNAVIGFAESPQITSALPQDTWTKFGVQGVAPANTASAQAVLVHVQLDPITGGSVFFDDAFMELVPEPSSFLLFVSAVAGGFCAIRRRHRRQR